MGGMGGMGGRWGGWGGWGGWGRMGGIGTQNLDPLLVGSKGFQSEETEVE